MKNHIHSRINRLGLTLLASLSSYLSAAELKVTLTAAAINNELGSGFAAVGDVNGDGVVDLAVADRSARVGAYLASGMVYIVSGADGTVLRSYTGTPAASQSFGSALVALNADGDAIPDLAVSAPGQAGPGGFGAGAVRIYAGADGALLATVLGPAGSQMGAALANAGDQNGDGVEDLYVGAPIANASRGAVYVLSGHDGQTLRTITTENSTSSFGISLAVLGDVDGDGRNDLAVGAPGYRGVFYQAGRVLLVRSSGDAVGPALVGSSFYNRLGESLASVADANGDGYPDVYFVKVQQLATQLVDQNLLSKEEDRQIFVAARQGALHPGARR